MKKSETKFLQRGKEWFYVSPEGSVHRITKISIIANGTHDLCIFKGPLPGSDTVGRIAEVDKEDIVYVPLGDILWLNITPPYKGTGNSIIMDIGYDKGHVKPLVMAMLKSLGAKPSDRGNEYDAYLGGNYFDESSSEDVQGKP